MISSFEKFVESNSVTIQKLGSFFAHIEEAYAHDAKLKDAVIDMITQALQQQKTTNN
jgi:hypothetical protein